MRMGGEDFFGGRVFVSRCSKDFTPRKMGPFWINCLPYANLLLFAIFAFQSVVGAVEGGRRCSDGECLCEWAPGGH